jgi:hypothetical protein
VVAVVQNVVIRPKMYAKRIIPLGPFGEQGAGELGGHEERGGGATWGSGWSATRTVTCRSVAGA